MEKSISMIKNEQYKHSPTSNNVPVPKNHDAMQQLEKYELYSMTLMH